MRLNLYQWLWMLAALAFIAMMLLQVAEVIQVRTVLWLIAAFALLFVGRIVGPSMNEIRKVNRRG